MSQYTEAVKRITEAPGPAPKRTDYRCRANGCPNAGCMDDEGEQKRGMCYFHWKESDPLKWPALTQRIRETWPQMANHGPQPEPPNVGDRRDGNRDWAHALKAREDDGEMLTLGQRVAWREALGRAVLSAIPSWEQDDDEVANPLLATTAHRK